MGMPVDGTITDNIYYNLRNSIAQLQLEPGQKLSEAKLARQYDCSRIPVREAVKRLASEGCLDVYPKRGSYVAPIDLVQMERTRYIREILETRVVLDDYDKGLLQPIVPLLHSLIDRQEELIQANDYPHLLDLDNEFHHMFFSIDHKDFAYEASGINEINYCRARLITLKAEAKTHMISQHIEIVNAIENQDRMALQSCLVQHLRNVSYAVQNNTYYTDAGQPYFRGEAVQILPRRS